MICFALVPLMFFQSWAGGYHQYVHYDQTTGVALISIANSGEPLNQDQIQSAWGILYQIADRNKRISQDCLQLDEKTKEEYDLYARYQQVYVQGPGPADLLLEEGTTTTDTSTMTTNNTSSRCWIPVVNFDDGQPGNLQRFIDGIMKHPYPPAVIIDVDNNAGDVYPEPTLLTIQANTTTTATTTTDVEDTTTNTNSNTQTILTTKSVWVHSFGRRDDMYYQHQLHISDTRPPTVENVTLITRDMEVIPTEYKDDIYAQHIAFLRQQADQALQNDPQVGYATFMPVARDGEYRRCQGGECEIGNLFTDAMRWQAHADVAFVTSGGFRGEGWDAGPVHISNIVRFLFVCLLLLLLLLLLLWLMLS